MSELEVPARIAALRATFHTIEVVLDPQALAKEIARLSKLASEPDLWGGYREGAVHHECPQPPPKRTLSDC